jgi:hypothetical protein
MKLRMNQAFLYRKFLSHGIQKSVLTNHFLDHVLNEYVKNMLRFFTSLIGPWVICLYFVTRQLIRESLLKPEREDIFDQKILLIFTYIIIGNIFDKKDLSRAYHLVIEKLVSLVFLEDAKFLRIELYWMNRKCFWNSIFSLVDLYLMSFLNKNSMKVMRVDRSEAKVHIGWIIKALRVGYRRHYLFCW